MQCSLANTIHPKRLNVALLKLEHQLIIKTKQNKRKGKEKKRKESRPRYLPEQSLTSGSQFYKPYPRTENKAATAISKNN